MSTGRIAILIDGGFFLKRLPRLVPANRCESPGKIVACIRHLCRTHVKLLTGSNESRWQQHVYRIFFYDAVPYDGKAHHPIDNRSIDFAKSAIARDRLALFELLRKERKLALRLGKVIRDHDWAISPSLTKRLLRTRNWVTALDGLDPDAAADPGDGSVKLSLSQEEARSLIELRQLWRSLDGGTVNLGLRQKGVDMRIGLDIASLTLKKQADTIVLVAGDSDFVPAAKLARREGMEFILDPLWQKVNADLFEHIDGLQSGLRRPGMSSPSPHVPLAANTEAPMAGAPEAED
ncbi:MAG TPA: NYN domain-containing protein [Rhodocyclaceae bacterium]|nr:NYN domain-containing protein [Rhodocyclaceae bacterium]